MDRVPTIDEIDSAEKLEAYLKTRPVEEAQLLSFRTALRAMPFIENILSDDRFNSTLKKLYALAVYRAVLVSWIAFSNKSGDWATPLSAAASFADRYGFGTENGKSPFGNVAYIAGNAAHSLESSLDARLATVQVFQLAQDIFDGAKLHEVAALSEVKKLSASRNSVALLNQIHIDLDNFATVGDRSALLPIWSLEIVGQGYSYEEASFSSRISDLGRPWDLVYAFYGLFKRQPSEFINFPSIVKNAYLRIAREDNVFWERDPDEVMKDIAGRLRGDLSGQLPSVSANGDLAVQKTVYDGNFEPVFACGSSEAKIDFFVSYSTKNETVAREINSYLEDAGYSTIAQFKDFQVGSNFVIEMQEGLERGARAIALLSSDYVASDHCRAEWAAIYNMDPIGKKRKLVSFLLEPTELNKLQRQIVYRSLIGLKQDARREAVLDAIRHVPEVIPQNQLKRKLADIASPTVAVTADGKIDVTPNAKYDLAVSSTDLLDLPEILRNLCSVIERSLPENSPKSIGPSFEYYRRHLEERGARPIVGLLGILVTALTKEFESADFEFWGAGLSELFERFFANHSKFLGHFPRLGEREQTFAEAEIDEVEASGDDLVQPVQSVADVVEELKGIGKVTPGLERVVRGQVKIARDISNLPPNLSEDAGKGTVITPKRRFVLSQLGFWERMLAAVGSMTTLATTPQGQAAIAALQEAIAKFLSLIL